MFEYSKLILSYSYMSKNKNNKKDKNNKKCAIEIIQ